MSDASPTPPPTPTFASEREVRDAVGQLVRAPHVAVALDFDGVLAPLGDDPMAVRMVAGAREVLDALAAHPRVTLALVSGRRCDDIVALASPAIGTLLATSHGAEHAIVGPDGVTREGVDLTDTEVALIARLDDALATIAADAPGAWVETKPYARVLHTRKAARDDARAATEAALAGPGGWDGVRVIVGKDVVEAAARGTTKADGVAWVRAHAAESSGCDEASVAVLFAGDDVTDEDALRALRPGDLGVKVGGAETAARMRVADEDGVVALLRAVHEDL